MTLVLIQHRLLVEWRRRALFGAAPGERLGSSELKPGLLGQ